MFEELSDALQDKTQLSRVWGYTPYMGYELFIEGEQQDFDYFINFLANYLIASLRIISSVDFIVPMVSNYSWSCIPGASENSVKVVMLEDYPKAKLFDEKADFTQDSFEWVNNNINNLYKLLTDYDQLKIAVNAFISYNQHADERMFVASLWVGLEAIMAVNQELSFRLAAYISSYLEPFGEERLCLFNKLKKMYSFRSKAIHGERMKDDLLIDHII